ncbi:DOMON domain-containing protein [Spirochaeta isovalerica]|uniref:DOMON domain-containing protein n=1 Tax=Spirochaeta isovalerica TaxID=150 RepID=A0A841RBI0_9SPIO|nr:DOMON domain-containing protein [Spirochaeta isovalerica]MBB6480370.1 hypothetical protein [Spirochaeta isovalerica]
MKKVTVLSVFLFLLISILSAQSGYNKREQSGISFEWKIIGSQLQIRLSAPTEGWIAVGFNPSRMMKDADYKMAYVDGDVVVLEDHFGTGNISHKKDSDIGGTDDFQLISGSESNGTTTVEFTMPLNSGDEMDSVLSPGDEVKVLLAYANRDSLSRKHSRRTSLIINL